MARMYSGRKGKAGSKKPARKKIPSWVRYNANEIEMLITKLAKEGKSPSQIGLILRDRYGIPNIKEIVGKKVTKLLEEKKLRSKLPEDLLALIKKSIALRKHIETNHNDESSRRGLILTESKIKRLAKYYKRIGRLEEDWKFQPERVRMYLE